MLLDGDQIRHGLNGDLGFDSKDHEENIRRDTDSVEQAVEQVLQVFLGGAGVVGGQ